MNLHNLKTLQPYFDDVLKGKKNFELRKDDRDYQVGDVLRLFEGDEQVDDFQARENKNFIYAQVIYKLEGGIYGLEEGFCILGIDRYVSSYDQFMLLKNFTVREYSSGDWGDLGKKVGTIQAESKEEAKLKWQKLHNISDYEINFYAFN